MPQLDEIIQDIGQTKILSKFELVKGFYQVPMSLIDEKKTTLVSPMGRYYIKIMLFGLKNIPTSLMNRVLYRRAERIC